ncbi:4Fe-4S dicluster domain-containing protein [Desulfovibrio sp. Huiquan2017]|uniref:4Fe-4S dicluster domain-containing protein n=1 Tax=Desulfovibrio sp. Huiquan2017 TaxID=2816861 RepID=UPI001A933E9A
MSLSRRNFLGLLRGGRTESAAKAPTPGTGKRASLAGLLRTLDARGPLPGGMAAGTMRSNGNCTACGACAKACATGALTLTGDSVRTLTFTPALCVACGACVKVCLPSVLSLSPASLESLAASPRVLFRGDTGTCKRCRAKTAALDENGLCPVCARKLHMLNDAS